jgi:hypothetical protein
LCVPYLSLDRVLKKSPHFVCLWSLLFAVVEKVWDELEERLDDQRAVEDTLSSTLLVGSDLGVDDSALERELEELVRDNVLPSVATSPAAASPTLMSASASAQQVQDDADLAELERSLAALQVPSADPRSTTWASAVASSTTGTITAASAASSTPTAALSSQ